MPVAVAVSVFGSGCFIVWSFVLKPSLRMSMMIERPASILALKRSRITMLGPEVVLFAAGVDSTRTACAAAGRDEEPRISIARKRCPSRVATRPRNSIDWKFLRNKLLIGTARRSRITDISNPQMFGAPADLHRQLLRDSPPQSIRNPILTPFRVPKPHRIPPPP